MNKAKTKKKSQSCDIIYYNASKRGDPLRNRYPRRKGGKWTIRKKEREEVIEQLYPFLNDFIKTRLKWKKMPRLQRNDTRATLIQFFIGKDYPSQYQGGVLIKKQMFRPPAKAGKSIMDTIKEELGNKFTDEEICNTMINVIYKNRVDPYTITLKPFVNIKPDKSIVSLWDKISETVQV